MNFVAGSGRGSRGLIDRLYKKWVIQLVAGIGI